MGPIKFDPNEKLSSEEKARKTPAIPDRFKDVMEEDSKKTISKLKRHNRGLDAESEDLEEFGKVRDPEKGPTLFDLSASKKAQNLQTKEEEPEGTMKKSPIGKEEPKPASAGSKVVSKEKSIEAPQKERPIFISEKPKEEPKLQRNDIITPEVLTQSAAAVVSHVKVEAPRPAADMQELINQIADHLSEMRYAGKTETLVTLKHPPLFANANLVLTSFDSAKGEFNISFENLTQLAKDFLDSGGHLDRLRANLEQKGFVAHIVTTTTIIETRVYEGEKSGMARDGESRREGGDQKEQSEDEEST